MKTTISAIWQVIFIARSVGKCTRFMVK